MDFFVKSFHGKNPSEIVRGRFSTDSICRKFLTEISHVLFLTDTKNPFVKISYDYFGDGNFQLATEF